MFQCGGVAVAGSADGCTPEFQREKDAHHFPGAESGSGSQVFQRTRFRAQKIINPLFLRPEAGGVFFFLVHHPRALHSEVSEDIVRGGQDIRAVPDEVVASPAQGIRETPGDRKHFLARELISYFPDRIVGKAFIRFLSLT